jgi:hypothetical protein
LLLCFSPLYLFVSWHVDDLDFFLFVCVAMFLSGLYDELLSVEDLVIQACALPSQQLLEESELGHVNNGYGEEEGEKERVGEEEEEKVTARAKKRKRAAER